MASYNNPAFSPYENPKTGGNYSYMYGPPKYSYAGSTVKNDDYYTQVGHALGFTEQEIRSLVQANDSGVSFATLATLIEEHPPVLSSAYTPLRRIEEKEFYANVAAAVAHHKKSLPTPPAMPFNNKKPANSKKKPNFGYVPEIYAFDVGGLTAADFDTLALEPALPKMYKNILAQMGEANKAPWHGLTFTAAPKHGLVLPKTGEYAKLLGIWLP